MKTVIALFKKLEDADTAVHELKRRGFTDKEIGVLASEEAVRELLASNPDAADASTRSSAAEGMVGAGLGGTGGLLLGLSALAIPGMGATYGAVVLAGSLFTAATGAGMGALAGSMIGSLINQGIPENEAQLYVDGVDRGGVLIAVKANEEKVAPLAKFFQERANLVSTAG